MTAFELGILVGMGLMFLIYFFVICPVAHRQYLHQQTNARVQRGR